jgi:hypothetical protein
VNVLIKAVQFGLILAVIGLSILITLPATQLTLFLSSATLFISSIVGLVHMVLTKVEPADLEGHRDILGIASVEFMAAVTMMLKYLRTVDLFWNAFLAAVVIFAPAAFGLFIPLIRKRRDR